MNIAGEIQVRDVEPSTILPVLRRYIGPYEIMAIILFRSTLTHLSTRYRSPGDLTAQLQGTRRPHNTTSLDATFDTLDITTLGTICT